MTLAVPVTVDSPQESLGLMRQVVAAINELNKSEFLERGQELRLRRSPGKRPKVDVLDRETGEVLDELPPEAVLSMLDQSDKEREGEL